MGESVAGRTVNWRSNSALHIVALIERPKRVGYCPPSLGAIAYSLGDAVTPFDTVKQQGPVHK